MHPACRLFLAPGQTFSRTCRDLSVDTPMGRWNQVEAQPALPFTCDGEAQGGD